MKAKNKAISAFYFLDPSSALMAQTKRVFQLVRQMKAAKFGQLINLSKILFRAGQVYYWVIIVNGWIYHRCKTLLYNYYIT